MLTLSQSAAETGRSKSVISAAIKSGKISAKRDGNQYQIDPAELFRVFAKSDDTVRSERGSKNETVPLEERLIESLIEQVRDLRRERDHWRELSVELAAKLPESPKARQKILGLF